ncbi:DUF6597 domain-containing transcriptional factor [Streptomyces sp. NBC_01198]|uniref:DUF6597 domain-containing transcriptional factor n=1 Tax=Streptomyces sp. NBC_01198 TaxID=2903769 RepID=UPI002E0E1D03|nr:hypothetical protein OG702_07110 [Streptomyces sp. NBC_01198]
MERYGEVRWDYDEPYRRKIVPYPNVQLSFGGGHADVHGVRSGYRIQALEGRGHVFGVAFRPGCFRLFLDAAVSTITDCVVPATEVFGPDLAPADNPIHPGGRVCARCGVSGYGRRLGLHGGARE